MDELQADLAYVRDLIARGETVPPKIILAMCEKIEELRGRIEDVRAVLDCIADLPDTEPSDAPEP